MRDLADASKDNIINSSRINFIACNQRVHNLHHRNAISASTKRQRQGYAWANHGAKVSRVHFPEVPVLLAAGRADCMHTTVELVSPDTC